MVDLILAGVLLLVSVALLGYLGALLVRAAGVPLGGLAERRRISRSLARGRSADRHMAAGDVAAAVAAIRLAFYLRPLSSSASAAQVANHHTGLLSRLLALSSEERRDGVRLLSLAKVDRLLAERSALQRRLLAETQNRTQRHEVETRLTGNAAELAKALDQLASEVLATHRAERTH